MTTETKPYSKPRPLNSRQRQFCINYMSGMTQTEAYIQAGYPAVAAKENASRLMLSNAHVKAYCGRLAKRQESLALAEGAEKLLSKSEKRQILATFARAQLAELLDDTGNIKLDKSSPSMKALKEYSSKSKLDKQGNPIVSKHVKLIDAITAIQEDNKMSGDYAPTKHQVAKAVQINVSVVDKTKRGNQEGVTAITGDGDVLELGEGNDDV